MDVEGGSLDAAQSSLCVIVGVPISCVVGSWSSDLLRSKLVKDLQLLEY